MKDIKKHLKNGETVIGTFLSLGHPLATEIVAAAGFDWVLIDLEHGIGNEKDVLAQLQALSGLDTCAIIRVESSARQRIHKMLDAGAHGIMCPHIDNQEEADQVVRAMRYPPEGVRGVAKMVRATGFGKNFAEYCDSQSDRLLTVVQVETSGAVEHIEEIASHPGVDVLFIGPADLSMSLGVFGQWEHPVFAKAENKILRAAERYGKTVGILLFDPKDYRKYHDKGVRFFACGTDISFLLNGAENVVRAINKERS